MSRLIFLGSPKLAVPSLKALHQAGHEIVAVLTQPDKAQGRGLKLLPPPVKQAASELGLPILQPPRLKDPVLQQELKTLQPDFLIVVAYGKILPPEVLAIPEIACINAHFSLLPKYRGAACIAYPLLHGDAETGVTTMLMEAGLDTGPILMQWSEEILPEDTAGSLTERLAPLAAQQLVHTLAAIEQARLQATPQSEAEASLAPRLNKSEGHFDFGLSALELYRRYQAFTPWPGAYSFLEKKRILWSELRYSAQASEREPGTLEIKNSGEVVLHARQGQLQVIKLKLEGKQLVHAEAFARGWKGERWVKLD